MLQSGSLGVKVCYFSTRNLFKKLPLGPTDSKRVNVQLEVSGWVENATIWKALYKWMESSVTYFYEWLRGGLVLGAGQWQDFICNQWHQSKGRQDYWRAGGALSHGSSFSLSLSLFISYLNLELPGLCVFFNLKFILSRASFLCYFICMMWNCGIVNVRRCSGWSQLNMSSLIWRFVKAQSQLKVFLWCFWQEPFVAENVYSDSVSQRSDLRQFLDSNNVRSGPGPIGSG